jgi:hypothetical protein
MPLKGYNNPALEASYRYFPVTLSYTMLQKVSGYFKWAVPEHDLPPEIKKPSLVVRDRVSKFYSSPLYEGISRGESFSMSSITSS